MTTRARKAAPVLVCCDCHERAESICGGCCRTICGSDACLAAHSPVAHRRKAAPNPHDQVARELLEMRRK